jgi:hypothetical protein
MKTGRNEPCPCGSGKKYKHCCLGKETATSWTQKALIAIIAVILLGGLFAVFASFRAGDQGVGQSPGAGKVWSEEHQHWH